jgi:ribose/xylose/arabinose/galactoside ABC-type transport system permease subunit
MLSNLARRHESVLLLAIFVVIILTTLVDSQHSYWNNPGDSVVDIMRQTALLGIFTLGAAIVIISGGIDLSSGSMIAFSGTICATIMLVLAPEEMRSAQPVGIGIISLAIVGTLVVGFLIGSMHAWLITSVGLPPFVATLASLVGLRSLGRALVEYVNHGNSQINIFDQQFRYLATSVWIPVVIFVVLSVVAWIFMTRTVTGRHIYALGGNEDAAKLSGIRTVRLKWVAYVVSAILSSIAGILYVGDQSVAAPESLGRAYELNAIAAAVVGGCSLQGGIGTIPGTVLGAFFLRIVIDGVAKIIKSGADVYEGLIVGIVVVFAVALSQLREALAAGRRFFVGPLGIVAIVTLAVGAGLIAMLFADSADMNSGVAGSVAGTIALGGLISIYALEASITRRKKAGR